MWKILVAAATLSAIAMGPNTAMAGLRKTITCEGTLRYSPPESRYMIGSYKIETKAAPWGGCWFNDNEPPKDPVLNMCKEGSVCRIKAYGECQLPTIVEKSTPQCPSLHIERATSADPSPLDVPSGVDLDWRKMPRFRTPSNQIHCMFVGDEKKPDPTGVACDINQSFVRIPIRPRPKDCNLDWGQRFELGADSDAGLECASDWVGSEDGPFLTYGNSVKAGKIVCTSAETGLTCKNADGHGFILSRRSQKIF